MAEVKAITEEVINHLAGETGFNTTLLLKDYYITAILYLLRDVDGIYFKGGTALQKIFLNYARLSEDIDFTLTRELKNVKQEIVAALDRSGLFEEIGEDKSVEGFTRLVVHYKGFLGEGGIVVVDLNQRGKLETRPERHEVRHFYSEQVPSFSLMTLSREEMIAEKIAAAIGRNKPRDHYDIYQVLKQGYPLNMELAKKKCLSSGVEFSIIKMFDNAKKLNRRWNEDMASLLAEEVSFQEVMQTLATHFKLKDEKDKLRKN